ncbi:hypothetical protein, partial [Citrobacter sp. U14242]|uniref:hypothetical protein n=1 Tax=Citrobacter sp. U14242 TaxID=3390192 RepID=UPI0039785E52
MPRRQILSSEEQERLLVIPDDEIILTRMCFLNEPDIALINKHRRGTVAKLAMRQPFVLFKGLTFQKLCLPGAFR